MLAQNNQQDPYGFSAQPKVVPPRTKFRPDQYQEGEYLTHFILLP